MVYALLVVGTVLCAIQAMRARQLLAAALWLAGVSALVSVILYRLGAQEIAVIELSVGAGLVTVLFVFAISIAGDDALGEPAVIPHALAVGMILVFLALLGGMVLPVDGVDLNTVDQAFSSVLWGDRGLDVLVQIVLIFTGVLGLVGILKDTMTGLSVQHGTVDFTAELSSGQQNGHGPVEALDAAQSEPAREEVVA